MPSSVTVCGASANWLIDGQYLIEHDVDTLKQYYRYAGEMQDSAPSSLVIWFDKNTWIINRSLGSRADAWYHSEKLLDSTSWWVSPNGSSDPDWEDSWEESGIVVSTEQKCPTEFAGNFPLSLFVCNSLIRGINVDGEYTKAGKQEIPRYVRRKFGWEIRRDIPNGVWMLSHSEHGFFYSFQWDILAGKWFDADELP